MKTNIVCRIIAKFNRIISNINASFFYFLKNNFLETWGATYYCKGDRRKLRLGKYVSPVNTLFNVSSGCITVGDNTIFGHNVMVLTGKHEFLNGKRKSLTTKGFEVPLEGYDINIGSGCWIASGVIITGKVNIGDNVIIGAGSVVTKDIPSGVFAAGVPAKILRTNI